MLQMVLMRAEQLINQDMRHRVRDVRYALDAVIRAGGVTIGMVEVMAKRTVAQMVNELNAQQQNGTWKLTAWRIDQLVQTRRPAHAPKRPNCGTSGALTAAKTSPCAPSTSRSAKMWSS